MAPKSAANATKPSASTTLKAPAKKITKKPTTERKILPLLKKRQPLGPLAHNSRQGKAPAPAPKRAEVIEILSEDEDGELQPPRKVLRRDMEDEGQQLSALVGRFREVGKGKGKLIDTPTIKIHPPPTNPALTLPPPIMSPATNIYCIHNFAKYRSTPVGFGALGLARGEKAYAGDGYIDELVGNDMRNFERRIVEGQWRRSVEVEREWPGERVWKE